MTKVFYRWQEKSGVTESALINAVAEMESGLIDADLGGSVYKKRIAVPGRGKRGGVRTIVAMKAGERYFFLYGYPKSELGNISRRELNYLKEVAAGLLGATDAQIDETLADGLIKEVTK